MKSFNDIFDESINRQHANFSKSNRINVVGPLLGLLHESIKKTNYIPGELIDLVELLIEMAKNKDIPEIYSVACIDACCDYLKESTVIDTLTLYDIKLLQEHYPWCVDEDGDIIIEEVLDVNDDFDILDAASKAKLNKLAKNPKSVKLYAVDKKYDKYTGLSKKQIKSGMIMCPPGTPAAGKIRKKCNCGKRTDPVLSRKLKQAARQNKSSRSVAAKKAAKTRKRLSGRRRPG